MRGQEGPTPLGCIYLRYEGQPAIVLLKVAAVWGPLSGLSLPPSDLLWSQRKRKSELIKGQAVIRWKWWKIKGPCCTSKAQLSWQSWHQEPGSEAWGFNGQGDIPRAVHLSSSYTTPKHKCPRFLHQRQRGERNPQRKTASITSTSVEIPILKTLVRFKACCLWKQCRMILK